MSGGETTSTSSPVSKAAVETSSEKETVRVASQKYSARRQNVSTFRALFHVLGALKVTKAVEGGLSIPVPAQLGQSKGVPCSLRQVSLPGSSAKRSCSLGNSLPAALRSVGCQVVHDACVTACGTSRYRRVAANKRGSPTYLRSQLMYPRKPVWHILYAPAALQASIPGPWTCIMEGRHHLHSGALFRFNHH